MKKLFYPSLMALAMFAFTQSAFAQFGKKGDSRVNLGVGVVPIGAQVSYEKVIQDNIGIGGFAAYSRPNLGVIGALTGIRSHWNYFHVGARGAYHLSEALNLNDEKTDLYIAAGLGVRFGSYNYDALGTNYNDTSIGLSGMARVGANMALSDKMGGWAEIGWGPSWITAGISFSLSK